MNEKSIEARIHGYKEDKEFNSTPLMWAVREKDIEVITFLLSRWAETEVRSELDKQDSWGRTPLHLACSYKPDLKTIKLLLDAGANPDLTDNNDETTLIKAIQTANSDVVALLLQRGANIKGRYGREALEVAESYGLIAITELLKQAGAES